MDLGIPAPISIYLDLFEKVNAHFSLMFCSSDSSFFGCFQISFCSKGCVLLEVLRCTEDTVNL